MPSIEKQAPLQNTGLSHDNIVEAALDSARAELERRVAERTMQLTAANHELEKEIAEHRQAEAQRERFFIILPDMFCIAGMDGQFKRLNPAFTQMLGYTADELMSRPVIDFVHPDDRAATLAAQRNLGRGEPMIQFENRYQHKDGSSRWLSWKAQPVLEEGLVYATARDITEQKASEYELRRSRVVFENLFKSLPGLYLVLTPDLKIVTASDAYLIATNTTLEDLLGRGLFEAFPENPDDPAATSTSSLSASMERVLETGAVDTMAIMKYDIRLADGAYEERYWSPVNSPVFGLDHRIEYIINHVADVTEFVRQKSHREGNTTRIHTRLEQMEAEIFHNSQMLHAANRGLYHANTQLLQATAEADAANRAKSTFLSTMSHEIRTPMNAILGYAQLMLRDPSMGADAIANLKIIGRSGEHLLALINEVLDMSKIEAGRMELNPATFSLSGLLDDLAPLFHVRSEAKGLRFELLVDGEPVPYIVADEGKLRQVLINLLGNAIKFTALGQIKLHVTLEQRSVNRLWLSARFEDTGSGISDEQQANLFEPFSQIRPGLQSRVPRAYVSTCWWWIRRVLCDASPMRFATRGRRVAPQDCWPERSAWEPFGRRCVGKAIASSASNRTKDPAMISVVRFAAAAALLTCAACSVTTAPPAPAPVVVQQPSPSVTTAPPGSTIVVPRPAY